MRWLLLCLLLASCGSPAEAQWRIGHTQRHITALWQTTAPPLAAAWQGDTLIVTAAPGCLYLVGNNRPVQFVGCGRATYVLPMYGDVNLVAPGRTLVLVSLDGQTETARLVVPSRYRLWMPWMVG
jgi:hypothetical protein